MIRKIAFLAPFALLGLAACDGGPATLAKAQPGECYAVTGRKAGGEPVWAKTPCAPDQTAIAALATAACPTPVTCPTTAKAPSVAAAKAGNSDRVVARRTQRQPAVRRTPSRDYARVPQDDNVAPSQSLLGGPEYRRDDNRHEQRNERVYLYPLGQQPYRGMPPLPPTERYEHREHGFSDRGNEGYGRVPPPPPVPPMPPRANGFDGHGYSEGYSTREDRGYRSSRSRSSSSSTASSDYGDEARGGPCCETGRGTMAPMNGPHFPIDNDGFLTWRGKTPGY